MEVSTMGEPNFEDRRHWWAVVSKQRDEPRSNILTIGGTPVIDLCREKADAEEVRDLAPERLKLRRVSDETLSLGKRLEDLEQAIDNGQRLQNGWVKNQ
jgi:hypothetical protein